MKVYEAVFNEGKSKGVYGISLVENPAMEGLFVKLSKDENTQIQFKEVDTEQRLLMGLVLEPNKPVYRNQDGEEFYLTFSEKTIKKLAYNFFKAGNQSNSSLEHDSKIEGVTFVESWIVEDPEKDKSSNFGFSYPKGTWMSSMKVDSEEIWNDYVKTGKVKGFSVDAMLSLKEVKLKTEINMSNTILEMLKDLPSQIALALNPKKESEVKLGEIKTKDGEVTLYFDGEMMALGNPVWLMAEDGTKVPLPVGEYELESDMILVVTQEGMIGELKEPVAEQPKPEEMSGEDGKVANDAKIASEIESAIKSILIKYGEIQADVKTVKDENETLKTKIAELSKEPSAKPIKSQPTQVALTKTERLLETIRNSN